MTHLLAIDFETAWDKGSYSVKDLGNWLYCQDKRFAVLSVAIHDGERGVAAKPEAFDWAVLHGATLVAHNAPFDRAVFDRLQELGIVPAGVRPARENQESSFVNAVRWSCRRLFCRSST